MADEIQISTQLTLETSKGVKIDVSNDDTFDQTGSNVSHHTQNVPSTEEALEVGLEGVTTANEGWFYIKNLGGTSTTATEYVTVGELGKCYDDASTPAQIAGHDQASCLAADPGNTWTDGVHVLKLIVGETVLFRAGITALSVKASDNDTQIEIIAVEN